MGELERSLKGHAGMINCVQFSPNGQILASCAVDMLVKLWNMQTFKNYKTLEGHEHEVSGLAFAPGEYLLSCSRDQTIRIWDTSTGMCITKL